MTVWEPSRLADWLYDRLNGDATLQTALGGAGRIYRTVPQASTSAPAKDKYVTIAPLSILPVVCMGPVRRGVDAVYSVRVWGKSKPFSALADALDRIETLLYGVDVVATLGGTDWQVTVVERPEDSLASELEEIAPGGVVYRHAGRQWPIYFREAA